MKPIRIVAVVLAYASLVPLAGCRPEGVPAEAVVTAAPAQAPNAGPSRADDDPPEPDDDDDDDAVRVAVLGRKVALEDAGVDIAVFETETYVQARGTRVILERDPPAPKCLEADDRTAALAVYQLGRRVFRVARRAWRATSQFPGLPESGRVIGVEMYPLGPNPSESARIHRRVRNAMAESIYVDAPTFTQTVKNDVATTVQHLFGGGRFRPCAERK